jgi:hypothetical protein
MTYKVISQLTLNGETEEHIVEYSNYTYANDYYRDAFSVMAETIADYGGDFTISIFDGEKNIQRHTISTTINYIHNDD